MVYKKRTRARNETDDFYFLKKDAQDLIKKYEKRKYKSIYFEKYGIPIIIFILIIILILKYILFLI